MDPEEKEQFIAGAECRLQSWRDELDSVHR